MSDEAIQRTNDDATHCKRSAVQFGYWKDPYLEQMVKFTERKTPEIHLGYFTRVRGLMCMLEKCLPLLGNQTQIINLGAGFDTLYWRIKSGGSKKCISNFVEVDLPGVTARKCFLIKKSKLLLQEVAGEDGEVRVSRTDLHGQDYHVVAADITDLPGLEKKLAESEVNYDKPTIFLAECVLVYMKPKEADSFLKWCAAKFSNALVFLDHEQINMQDRFGQVMLENLSARGCGLPGVESCTDKSSQISRFLQSNWNGSQCWTMNEIYNLLPKSEIDSVERLELFDERELMKQLFEHYCLTFSWRNSKDIEFENFDIWR